MNKEEIVRKVSSKTGLDVYDTQRVITAFIDGMKQGLINGESIEFRGFGSFKPVERAEKKARDIGRGCSVTIPAHTTVKFVPSPAFKDAVNGR